ncbi:MAG: hypothetical protein F6K07_32765 [Okeania sp. SIO1H5]|nr:hypothetical protein [Okeania sp. SIO1H5]
MREPVVQSYFKSLLKNAYLVYHSFAKILDDFRPDFFFAQTSRHMIYEIPYRMVQKRGISLITHERGYLPESFQLFENFSKDAKGCRDAIWKRWKEVPLRRDQLESVKKWYFDREAGKGTDFVSFYDFSTADKEVRERLNVAPGKKIVTLLTSGDWEVKMWEHNYTYAFPNQIEWIRKTIELFRYRDEILVIRHHPSNGGSNHFPDSHALLEKSIALTNDLPSNVRLVMPYEQLTTYSLLWASEGVITLWSHTYAEAFFRGILPLKVSDGFLDEVGGLVCTDAEEYSQRIDEAIEKTRNLSVRDLRTLFRFTHLLVNLTSFQFSLLGMKETFGHLLKFQSVDELVPGRDPKLDAICEHILNGGPLYPEPTLQDQGTLEQETRFLEDHLFEIQTRRRTIRFSRSHQEQSSEIHLCPPPKSFHPSDPRLRESIERSRYAHFRITAIASESWNTPAQLADEVERLTRANDSNLLALFPQPAIILDESYFQVAMQHYQTNPEVDAIVSGGWFLTSEHKICGSIWSSRSESLDFEQISSKLLDRRDLLALFLWTPRGREKLLFQLRASSSWDRFAETLEMGPETDSSVWSFHYTRIPNVSIVPTAKVHHPQKVTNLVPTAVVGSRSETMMRISQSTQEQNQHANASHPEASWTLAPRDNLSSSPLSQPKYHQYHQVKHLVESVSGWLLEGQEEFLFNTVRDLPSDALIVEMGCEMGRSTAAMALACVGTQKRILSIDSFEGNSGLMGICEDFQAKFQSNMDRIGVGEYVSSLKGYTSDVLKD